MVKKTRPCAVCGVPIDPRRAAVVRTTRLCLEHARLIERFGGEFRIKVVRTSLGKQGSLKKNYGDFAILLKRNTLALEMLLEEHYQGEPAS